MTDNIKYIELEIELKNLHKENEDLKDKVKALRQENNSFLYSALSKFQGEMPVVPKTSKSFGNQTYASFATIKKIANPILAKHGLSIRQDPITVDGILAFKTKIMHSSGQFDESIFLIPTPFKEETHRNEIGSTMSYFKRHIYMSFLGIVAEDDE